MVNLLIQSSRVRPNKEISVFLVKGLKILGRVGKHKYYLKKKICKKYNFNAYFAFQNA